LFQLQPPVLSLQFPRLSSYFNQSCFDKRNMRTALLSLVLSFLSVHQLLAQSTVKIEGYVFTDTGMPLETANVVVLGTGYGAATDASGYFAIANLFAGEYELEVRFLGYRSENRRGVIVHKDFVTTVHFRLQPVVLAFDEVLVEARKEARTSAFQEIVSREEIKNSGAVSVGEILVHVPGIDIIDEGGGSGRKRVSIRGSNSNQVVVLLDGVPLNDPLVGDVDLSQISLSMIEEIRISKGGNSSSYGSGALGGVVEIISKKNSVDEIRLQGRLGQYGAFGIQPSISGTAKNLSYYFNFEHLREEGDYPYSYHRLDGTAVQEDRLNADFASQNYFGKIALDLHRHALLLQANVYRSDRGLPGLVFAWSPFATAETQRRILISRYSFNHRNGKSHVQISRHLNRTEFLNDPPPDAPLRFRSTPAYHTKYQILSHRVGIESTHKIKNKHLISLQSVLHFDNFRDENLRNGAFGPIKKAENRNASFIVRNEWRLPGPAFVPNLIVNHALRFDTFSLSNSQVSRQENQLSPRVGLLLSHNHGWILNLRANWGRSFRIPTFADLFYQDFRISGNPNLQPEKSRDFDSGLQVGWPFLGWLELSGAYFRHNVENLIVWQLGSFATWQPFNTNAFLEGVEIGGFWRLWDSRIQFTASHVFLNALDKSGQATTHNKTLPYRPGHTTKVGLQLNLGWLFINYKSRIIAKRFVTPSNTVSLPAYRVDDLSILLRKEFNKLKLSLKVSILNMLNEEYAIVERAPLPGRHWRVGIEMAN